MSTGEFLVSEEFDKDYFEQLMGEGVELHNTGQYEAALASSEEAFGIAPWNSSEKGRAARDCSARTDRLGRTEEAERWALVAYSIHNHLVRDEAEPTREAYRERAASALYVGVNGLRKAILTRAERRDEAGLEAIWYMRQTWSDLQAAKSQASDINQQIDQYEVNAARRVSMAESLFGDRRRGRAIGVRAVALAFMSESPRLDTSNPNISRRSRLRAKVKAFAGSVAAVGVGVLASPKDSIRRQAALELADRAL